MKYEPEAEEQGALRMWKRADFRRIKKLMYSVHTMNDVIDDSVCEGLWMECSRFNC